MDRGKQFKDRVAVITGASSGIGAAVAERLAKEGMHVVLIARRKDHLKKIANRIDNDGGQAYVLVKDLSLEKERTHVFERIVEEYGDPYLLINNAGFSSYGYFSDMPWEIARSMVEININAVIHLTRLFLPAMIKNRSGHIINIGSLVGQFPNQGTTVYAGTKAFLDAFTTAFYRENHGSGVTMSVIRPGPVATELFDVSENLPGSRRIPAERNAISADVVANKVWQVIKRPRRYAYVPVYTVLSPWVELIFGNLIDKMGPLLLKRN